jgi:hypothetical protein
MDWLIKLFGGYTKGEMALHESVVESWRARCIAAETTVQLFKEIMTRDQERYEKLLEGRSKYVPQSPPELKPVGNSISSWPRIKRELEKQHRVNEETPTKAEVENSM